MDNRRTVQLLCQCVAMTILTCDAVYRDVVTAVPQSTIAEVTAAIHRRFSTKCVFLIYVEGQMGEWAHSRANICVHIYVLRGELCRVIQKGGLNFVRLFFKIMAWTVNGASTHARQLVAVFQVLFSLYRLTCVGYAQNCLQFVSRSPLIHVVGRSFYLYTDSLFARIGDSNDKCSSSLEVECWNKDETHAVQQSPTPF